MQITSYDGKASVDPCSACMSMETMEDPNNTNEYKESRRDDIWLVGPLVLDKSSDNRLEPLMTT